ncbi:thaumatin family protein [Poronia punctata]|nr:thaumatin family protein [Poronia punctata]
MSRGFRVSLGTVLLLLWRVAEVSAVVFPTSHKLYKFDYLSRSQGVKGITRPLTKRDKPIPLIITNNCPEILWPGIASQAGEGPDRHGFELRPKKSRSLTVGPTWAGRVWGRTNCTVGGDAATCQTGDCMGKMDCVYGGAAPATLAEFNLGGGAAGELTFYDISLVDGYNLPLGIVYHPADNTTFVPPNLANPSCIGTAGFLSKPSRLGLTYTNVTYPMPYEPFLTNHELTDWCPWDLQVFLPTKPADGVYPYPDDEIKRAIFDPCKSACTANGSPQDCCTGEYGSSDTCKPSVYSTYAKIVCPDAYSYAYDDKTSTFAVPSGGRSTNILATYPNEMSIIARSSSSLPENSASSSSVSSSSSSSSSLPAFATFFLLSVLVVAAGANKPALCEA